MGSILGIKMSQCLSHRKSEDHGHSENSMDRFGKEESSMTPQKLNPLERPEMTEEQVQIVIDSWKIIKKDYDHIGVVIFTGLFQSNPAVQNVFEPFRGLPPIEMKTKLLPHGLVVMATIDAAVSRLRQPEKFESYMKDFSARHAGHTDRADYFDLFPPEFLSAAKTCIKDDWTPEIESAWTCFLQIILYYMKDAIGKEVIPKRKSIFNFIS